jgi:hypothetical protein
VRAGRGRPVVTGLAKLLSPCTTLSRANTPATTGVP